MTVSEWWSSYHHILPMVGFNPGISCSGTPLSGILTQDNSSLLLITNDVT